MGARKTFRRLKRRIRLSLPAEILQLLTPSGRYIRLYQTLLETGASKTTNSYVALSSRHTDAEHSALRVIAFYLPQFHPIPTNNDAWGEGFTEWTNVSKATPQFVGHYQPRLPGELGYYDLRLKDVQQRQIELARQHGVHGFCYHHYWFNGKRIMDKPFQQVLDNPELDLPFCLCWANENWTKRWDGQEHDVLLSQTHSPEDDIAFIKDIEPALTDSRYIRIDGKPLLILYRPMLLPDPAATGARWRDYARSSGIGEIYLVAAASFGFTDYESIGFDGLVQFPPNNFPQRKVTNTLDLYNPDFSGEVFDYSHCRSEALSFLDKDKNHFPTVMGDWDNEARKPEQGHVFFGGSPEKYENWLQHACEFADKNKKGSEKLVFINAWNEWAEGTYLEPDRKYGYAYLEKTANVVQAFNSGPKILLVAHDAHPHGAQYLIFHVAKCLTEHLGCRIEMIVLGRGRLMDDYRRYANVHVIEPNEQDKPETHQLLAQLHRKGYHSAIANSTVSGKFASLLKDANYNVVALIHELPELIKSYGLEQHCKIIVEKSDKVVFPSDIVYEQFKQFATPTPAQAVIQPQGLYKSNPYRELNNKPAASAALRKKLGLPESAKIVLCVGYTDHRKGVDLFIEAGLHLLDQENCSGTPNIWFVWLGEIGPFGAETLKQLDSSEFKKFFIFSGPDFDTDIYYAGADVYALTSREDPFPSTVLEALDAGTPVVGFEDAGGFCQLLQRDCGLLAKHLDPIDFSEKLRLLLDDPSTRKRLGNTGREIISNEYSFPSYVTELLNIATNNSTNTPDA
jgi:glycosyltransferase involved in cell wall biosynthesis